MPRRISLEPHANSDQLYKLYLKAKSPCERDRYHALWLLSLGKTTGEVAEVTRFSVKGLRTLVKRYNKGGLEAVLDVRRIKNGSKPLLNPEQCKRLEEALGQDPPQGGLWNSLKVAAWIQRETGHKANKQLGWDYLKRLEYALRVPRRRHRKGDPEKQEEFKKNSPRQQTG